MYPGGIYQENKKWNSTCVRKDVGKLEPLQLVSEDVEVEPLQKTQYGITPKQTNK